MKPSKRGVVYFTFGNEFPPLLERSLQSVREHNDLAVCWITEHVHEEKCALFDIVIKTESELVHGYHKRAATVFHKSPFEYTLSLDSDTVVCGSLNFGFEMAERHHLAICHAPASYGGSYVRDTTCLNPPHDDLVIYNCGVIFFDKSEKVRKLFERWQYWNTRVNTGDDQSAMALAVFETSFNPFVLSRSWNFRPSFQREGHGPIRIWHDRRPLIKGLACQERFWSI